MCAVNVTFGIYRISLTSLTHGDDESIDCKCRARLKRNACDVRRPTVHVGAPSEHDVGL